MGAYWPGIVPALVTIGFAVSLWALKKLIEETSGTRRTNTDSDLRAALAELENRLVKRLEEAVKEFHDCLDGTREDLAEHRKETRSDAAELRKNVRHDAANSMTPIIALIEQHSERLQRLERERRH